MGRTTQEMIQPAKTWEIPMKKVRGQNGGREVEGFCEKGGALSSILSK